MKIIAIKSKNGIFISDNVDQKQYFGSAVGNLRFDGEFPVKTYASDWWRIDKIPEIVEQKLHDKYTNRRWELKAGYPKTELTPELLTEDPNNDDSPFYELRNLYSAKSDVELGGFEKIDIELSVIAQEDEFKIEKQDFPVSYGILDRITVNPVLLPIKPCVIESKDLYHIIRNHVKKHINGAAARITSDYDFCFTVQKNIALADPEPYRIDVGTKRKPNLVIRHRLDKQIEVFQMAPAPYQSYTVIEPMKGSNYDDLKDKLKKYLDDLMDIINKPIRECPHCKGSGIEK